ncbi:MAG: 4-hydroxyphenylacetate decarboxylase activating enzyme [candidate division BRC1 bacterium ADurb.BinA364]|nr:MAG: 4-hydroxyphenylacetate decarboxylase activating enzyme [candidate division BRC1 bacterium ADurb.BinA364]
MRIRIPLIPAATDTDENIRAIFAFMRGAGLTDASLLPYNPSAGAKYEWLDREYTLQGEPQTRERLETLAALGREMGIQAASDGR